MFYRQNTILRNIRKISLLDVKHNISFYNYAMHCTFVFRRSFRIWPISSSEHQYGVEGYERRFKPIGCSAWETSHDCRASTFDWWMRKPRSAIRLAAWCSSAKRSVGRRQRRTRWLAGQVRACAMRAQPSLSSGYSARSRQQSPCVHVQAACSEKTSRIHSSERTANCFHIWPTDILRNTWKVVVSDRVCMVPNMVPNKTVFRLRQSGYYQTILSPLLDSLLNGLLF